MGTTFSVNGEAVELQAEESSPLILALRNELGLKGTRFGCGGEDCGACIVLVDCELQYSCTYQVADAAGKDVRTIEGLTGPVADVLRQAMVEAGAGQCGYCLSGIFVTAHELLAAPKRPSQDAVKRALARHLCRCGAHAAILRAIYRAIDTVAASGDYDG